MPDNDTRPARQRVYDDCPEHCPECSGEGHTERDCDTCGMPCDD